MSQMYALNPETEYKSFETEFYLVKDEDTLHNPLFGKLKFICYNICYYFIDSTIFTRFGIVKLYMEVLPELKKRNLHHLKCFIQWLLSDLIKETK
jgi:hypothetical protein